MTVLCQWCGAPNPDGRELCLRCNSRLLVVSGTNGEFSEETLEEEEASLEREKHRVRRAPARAALGRRGDGSSACTAPSSAWTSGSPTSSVALALLDSGRAGARRPARPPQGDPRDRGDGRLGARRHHRDGARGAARAAAAAARGDRLAGPRRRRRGGRVRLRPRRCRARSSRCWPGSRCGPRRSWREALRRFPRNPELAELLGELAFERSDLGAAENYFRQVLRWNPDDVEARIYLGTILADTGREPEAIEHLERAVALAPENFLPHFSLGRPARGRRARTEPARRHLQARARARGDPAGLLPPRHGRARRRPRGRGRGGARARRRPRRRVRGRDLLPRPRLPRAAGGTGRRSSASGACRRWTRSGCSTRRRCGSWRATAKSAPPLPPEAEVLVREASQASEAGEIERALAPAPARLAPRRPPEPARLAGAARGRGGQARARRSPRPTACCGSACRGAPVLAAWTALLETLRAAKRVTALVERLGGRLFAEGPGPLERGHRGVRAGAHRAGARRRRRPRARVRPRLARADPARAARSTRSRRSAGSTWRARSTRTRWTTSSRRWRFPRRPRS